MAITQNPTTNIPHGYDSIAQGMTTLPTTRGVGSVIAPPLTPSIGIFPPASTDYIIEGKMLTSSLTMSPYEAEQMDELEMKNRLISLMVREIMDNNCIEFTKQQDFVKDEVTIRARIFVTPKDDVQLIRKVLK